MDSRSKDQICICRYSSTVRLSLLFVWNPRSSTDLKALKLHLGSKILDFSGTSLKNNNLVKIQVLQSPINSSQACQAPQKSEPLTVEQFLAYLKKNNQVKLKRCLPDIMVEGGLARRSKPSRRQRSMTTSKIEISAIPFCDKPLHISS